jgi:hypothetical protein
MTIKVSVYAGVDELTIFSTYIREVKINFLRYKESKGNGHFVFRHFSIFAV